MTEIILKLIILMWPFGQLLRFNVFDQSIHLLDLMVIILTLSLLLNESYRNHLAQDKNIKYFLILWIIATLSLLVNLSSLDQSQFIRSFLYLARLYFYPSIFFATKFNKWSNIKNTFIVAIVTFTTLAALQYIFFPDATSLKYVGFDDHYYRVIGTFFDPNFTGLMLSVISLFLISQSRYIYSVLFIPLIALTFSRASFVVFGLGLILISIKKNPKILLIFAIILAVAILLSPKPFGEGVNLLRTFSIYSRLDSWKLGWDLFLHKPILGWGYNTLFNSSGQRIGIDNSFIYILATTGIAGFFSFIILIYQLLYRSTKKEYLVCLLVILLHSFFNNSLFFIWIFSAFWFISGLSQNS